MPQFPLFNPPPKPTGPVEYIDENDPRKQTSFLDAPADFVRGLGYFPTEPIPADASKAYTAGAAIANAAPMLGPALKGLGMAAPLVTIFKDAQGVPSAAVRESSTGVFREMARTLPSRMRAAALQFAEDYPRISAHMRPARMSPPAEAPESLAFVRIPHKQVDEPLVTGFTHWNVPETEYPQSYEEGLRSARNTMYHEGTHAAQALGNKNMGELYRLANQLVGPDLNPFEMTASRSGMNAELGGNALGPYPNAIEQLKNLSVLPGPHAEKIREILARRAGLAPAAETVAASTVAPSKVKTGVDLSRLPASLDYVQNELKGLKPMASHTDPAVQALVEAFEAPVKESSLAQHAATSRVTGRLRPQRDYINVPEGFEFPEGFKRSPGAPLSEEERIWRSWAKAQKEMRKDPRGKEGFGEVRQVESSPTIRSIEELQNLPVTAGQVKEQAPLLGTAGHHSQGPRNRVKVEGRVFLKDMTPDNIKEVQRAAGSGLNQKQLLEKFPQYSKETLARVVKMPWKD